jgi:hypothetical protein
MRAKNVILTFKALPIHFGGGATIEMALKHASQKLAAFDIEELLDLSMVELLGLGAA